MFWRAVLFSHNVWCWKKKSNICCILLKLYGCCTSLQTFFNFLIMKKEQKKQQNNSQDHLILKFSKKEGKRNSPRFWIWPEQTSSSWNNFFAGQKVSEEWKENFRISQESFEKLYTDLRPYQKQNHILRSNFSGETSGRNITLSSRWRQDVKNGKFFWYWEINSFKNYQECFVFTSSFFPHDYLPKQHNYFTNR